MAHLFKLLLILFCTLAVVVSDFQVRAQHFTIDTTVAQDGSGQHNKIQDAIDAAPSNSQRYFYIKIKAGTYRESVFIGPDKTRIALIGEGMYRTRVVGSKSFAEGFDINHSATIGINGDKFMAVDISFENDAGPTKMQAVALRSQVDSAFYRCRFLGYQDTLYAQQGRQFYRNCQIHGTIDFIFGDAAMVMQYCTIYVREPLRGQFNVITAQGRSDVNGHGGIVFHLCTIRASPALKKHQGLYKTYLGRPWKTYSRVVILSSTLEDLIDPRGWVEWNNETQVDKVYYGEYHNRGLGSSTTGRVKWPGFKKLENSSEANAFSVRNFIQGNDWLPSTGIPFILDVL